MTLQVGQVLYGYCGEYFGRDSYESKRVEAVGVDWVVAREISDPHCVRIYPEFAEGVNIHQDLEEYTNPPAEEE